VVHRAREQAEPERKRPSQPADEKASTIGSLGGLMHHIAKCCQPVPGEEIAGVVTRGSGIAVHRADCSNLLKVESERHMAVDWSEDRQSKYPAALKVECLDRVGIAGDILKKISDSNINLKDVRVETQRDANAATIYLVVEIADIVELTRVAQAISRISDVVRVQRQNHRKRRGEHSSNVTPLIERSSNRKKRARSSE